MSYQSLLTDRCDLFHLEHKESARGKFGIPADDLQMTLSYPDAPSLTDLACYVIEKTSHLCKKSRIQSFINPILSIFL